MHRRPTVAGILLSLSLTAACAGGAGGGDDVQVGVGQGGSEVAARAGTGLEPETTPAPGVVSAARPLGADLVPAGAIGWEIQYWSMGVHGQLVQVTGVVFAPDEPTVQERPIVAWAHGDGASGSAGVAEACAPTLQGAIQVPHAHELLAAGYVIAATDYEGLGSEGTHPYLVGLSAGRSVLDVTRAAGGIPGTEAGSDVTFVGMSQGGHAALMAAKMAPAYAPELDVQGVVSGAPTAELRIIMSATASMPSRFGFFAMAAAGFDYAYDELAVEDIFTPLGLELLDVVEVECVAGVIDVFDDHSRDELLQMPPEANAEWTAKFEENEVGTVDLGVPVLMLHGLDDKIILPIASEIAVDRLCEGGTDVEFIVKEGTAHQDLLERSADEIFSFLAARRSGVPPSSTC
jgi:pimeloyl-ACP methyl ester carboxylesterase